MGKVSKVEIIKEKTLLHGGRWKGLSKG